MMAAWLEISTVILAGYVGLFALAAVYDVYSFRIPNWISVALSVLFLAAAVLAWGETAWVSHIAAGLAVLVVGIVFFALGWLGGGDVKLIAGHIQPQGE